MFQIIGTWKMSFQGIEAAAAGLASGGTAGDAVEQAIVQVEDDPAFMSVGYGGLPDRDGHVKTDAGFMDGNTLRAGAVMSVESVANPIRLARKLCGRKTNWLLAGRGAEQAAISFGLQMKDMRTEASMRKWQARRAAMPEQLTAYTGHDTVCVLALDQDEGMVAGTSTSGLFLKEPGRVGDTPIIGSGFYCDARYGAAAATGLGEDIMRGCLSYEIVSLMRRGASPLEACQEALEFLTARKIEMGEDAGSISLIALNPAGETGAATTLEIFPYAVGGLEGTGFRMVGKDRRTPVDVMESDLLNCD